MTPTCRALACVALLASTAAAGAESRVERGRYLVQSIVGCGNCHTPQGPKGPLPGKALAGGLRFDEDPFTAYSSNITPDKATGIGRWTSGQIATAIREGKRPDGTLIGPPMPFGQYRGIADDDLRAIVAYLRTLTPVKNEVPRSEYRMPLPPAWGPPVASVPAVDPKDKLAWGAYLAGPLGHCIECHSAPGANGTPDVANGLGAGGMKFKGPWGVSVAADITPKNLARYSDAELKKVITTGVRPDGSRLLPPMGVAYYAKMKASDLDALVAYLRSLPPR